MSSDSEPRLLVANHHGVQVLITLWPDGTATIATRLNDSATWGPPTPLEETE